MKSHELAYKTMCDEVQKAFCVTGFGEEGSYLDPPWTPLEFVVCGY